MFRLDVAPGPPGCSGEVSSAQGNPLGEGSRAQLEELKELNADWCEGFDQRGIRVWTSREPMWDSWRFFCLRTVYLLWSFMIECQKLQRFQWTKQPNQTPDKTTRQRINETCLTLMLLEWPKMSVCQWLLSFSLNEVFLVGSVSFQLWLTGLESLIFIHCPGLLTTIVSWNLNSSSWLQQGGRFQLRRPYRPFLSQSKNMQSFGEFSLESVPWRVLELHQLSSGRGDSSETENLQRNFQYFNIIVKPSEY